MPSGLVALLDDIAGITKLAAASLDDVGATAGKAGMKAAGVVVDDTAVTPAYVTGFTPDRELPIIVKIAKGSLRNKLVILLPVAVALSALAPWAITPLLMLGGSYLCFEASEKILEALGGHHGDEEIVPISLQPEELEREKVNGAVRTDFILSAEIMAIALAQVADRPLAIQAAALAAVGIAITFGVYGVVGFIVKMDDIGLHLARRDHGAVRMLGRALVRAMPLLTRGIETIGTAAMLWVGGGIVVHGLEEFHWTPIPEWIHHASELAMEGAPMAAGALGWLVGAIGSAIAGLLVGAIVISGLAGLRAAGLVKPHSAH
jgi:predicted DNA repair protein MutK